jgi:histidyl-tRNA synthetase
MVRAVRGMRDILPQDARMWRHVEDIIQGVIDSFAYEEVRLPLLEFTELFARGVGEATDIVEKEMYTLADRDGDSLSLRPEGTASCVRALEESGLLYNQNQRVTYAGPMFRYEKPQKGRYRQFYQIGAEAFGFAGPDVDAELIAIGAACWKALGISQHISLEVNSLGSNEARIAYKEALVAYLTPLKEQLDEDSQRRLLTNPMRILDSKNPATQGLLELSPQLPDFVDEESKAHFQQLLKILDAMGITYKVNPNLVRGLDYYTHTVFEWVTQDLGSQGAVCAGGRYDGLVKQLGGRNMPAVGFAIGLDRVVLLCELVKLEVKQSADLYICVLGDELRSKGMILARQLRDEMPQTSVRLHMGGGNFKKQLKRADASGATWAILYGEEEAASGELSLKHLRDVSVGQVKLRVEQIAQRITSSI